MDIYFWDFSIDCVLNWFGFQLFQGLGEKTFRRMSKRHARLHQFCYSRTITSIIFL